MDDSLLMWLLFGPSIHYLSRPLDGRAIAFGQARSLDALRRLGAGLAGWHVWFCPNPSRSQRPKPTKEEITDVKWLILDQDQDTPEGRRALMAHCDSLDADYVTVFTGRGRHAWVRVTSTGSVSLDDAIIKGLTKAWSASVPHLDSSCAEVSRVVRLPGTINPKNGKRCFVESTLEGRGPLSLTDFKDLAVSAPAPAASGAQEALTGIELSMLGITAWNTWLLGPSVGTRHKELWHLAKSCRELGMDPQAVGAAVWQANERCKQPLSQLDFIQIMRQVFPKQPLHSTPTSATVPSTKESHAH